MMELHEILFLAAVAVFYGCTITNGIRGKRGDDRVELAVALGAVVLAPLLALSAAILAAVGWLAD